MDITKLTPESKTTVIHEIKKSSEGYFHDSFSKDMFAMNGFDAAEKLTGEFFGKKLRAFESRCHDGNVDDIKIVISVDDATYPVLRPVVATWKVGGLIKRAVKSVFLIWHPEITDTASAITMAEFNGFLNSNGLDDILATVNWVGVAISRMNIKALCEEISSDMPFFGCKADCSVDYSLKYLTFDADNNALVLSVERC